MPGSGPHPVLAALEQRRPEVSSLEKVLLLTDGSVTTLLEAVFGETVEVRTAVQQVVLADPEQAARLSVEDGAPVNHRVVDLVGTESGRVFVHAVSQTPLARLTAGARDDLLAADIPIGVILRRHQLETRREIVTVDEVPAGEGAARAFGLPGDAAVLCRRYVIVHDGRPLIWIQEQFAPGLFGTERLPVPGEPRVVPGPGTGRVIVEAPSRLHLGLIDLNGELGRVDGGIGLTLVAPCTEVEVYRHDSVVVSGADTGLATRIEASVGRMLRHLGVAGGAAVRVRQSTPRHIGLGSGTQCALAVGMGIARLYGRALPVREVARVVGRGGTSGIGTAAFEFGGFILDGGHSFGPAGEKTGFAPSSASGGVPPAPLIARLPFPEEWPIVLAVPRWGRTIGEAHEVEIFRERCPVPVEDVRRCCHEVVMRLLPGVACRDLALFAAAVNAIQELGFKRVELELQDARVRNLLRDLVEAGAACAGLSSFGPTVYAVTDHDPADVVAAARAALGEDGGDVQVTRARNCGAYQRTIGGVGR